MSAANIALIVLGSIVFVYNVIIFIAILYMNRRKK